VRAITEVCRESMSRADLDVLIAQSVALVHPYRAEGFYLGGLEAMSLGTAVVMTRGGAADEYATDSNAILVDGDVNIDPKYPRMAGEHGRIGGYYHWVEASVDHLSQALRDVLTNEVNVRERIEAGYQTGRVFSWSNCAQQAERSILAALTGEQDRDDRFVLLEKAVTRVLDTWSLADLHHALVLLLKNEDLHAAQQLLNWYPGELPPDKVAANQRLEALITERVDRWRDARYRVLMQELMKPARSSRSPAP